MTAPSEFTSDLTTSGSATARDEPRPSLLARLVLGLLALYRLTAMVRQPRCRFLPTCSAYAAESVRRHGAVRGGAYAIHRVARCHPWNPGGFDPVRPRN